MSINIWIEQEVVVHIHNGILLSHKKECIWVDFNEMDKPRVYFTEWSKSEREREILYSNTYMQNLEKWSWRIYLQGSDGETAIENRLMDTGRGEERVRCVERVPWKLALPYVKQIAKGICRMAQETQIGALYQPRGVGWGERWEGISKGRGYMYTWHPTPVLLPGKSHGWRSLVGCSPWGR